jgi:hypothetical protein
LSQIPGIGGLLSAGGSLLATDLKLAALAALLGIEGVDLIKAIEGGEIKSVADLPAFLESQLEGAVREGEELFGTPLWELLIRAPAGLDAAAIEEGQAKDAAAMVKRMLGFALALPLATARLEVVVKGILGAHAPEGLLESVRRLPEEIGINFFVGTVLERIFETAVATPLEEAIALQSRPARFDFRVIKALLTKHHVTREQADEYLANMGYRPKDIALILDLAEQFLSVADLQQLYLLGQWDEAKVRAYLASLGYTEADAQALVDLYLTRAETQGAQALRATLRTGYLEGHLTTAEYREGLIRVNTPAKSVDLEIESADDLIKWGRRQQTLGAIKTLHDQGHINDRQAAMKLEAQGFSEADAAELIEAWSVARKASRVGLSVQRILAYELGHVIDQGQAHKLLVAAGLKVDDAEFLARNPGRYGGIFAHPLSPATILSALREGVLDVEAAKAKLDEIGVQPEERDLMLAAAVMKSIRGMKPKAVHRNLSEGQMVEAFKHDLVTSGWLEAELTTLGFADADAQLIVAIEESKKAGHPPEGWVTLT